MGSLHKKSSFLISILLAAKKGVNNIMIEGKSLGEYINFKRNELGYGLREFAKEIGISHAYLSQIETSKKIPTKKKIKLIAIGLNVPEEDY